ncbi:MAG: serine hydrolase domain-containing protein [Rhodomicrobium sp.]
MTSSSLPIAIARQSCPTQGEHCALVPWWSITKSVLAVAVLRMAESGSLVLDGRLDDWPFTIRQVLQHTAGLANYGGEVYRHAAANGHPVWTVDELLERRNAKQLLFPPGEGWAYSNIGYLFIRQLIERITGLDLDRALRQLIFSPMGIERTRVAATPGDMAETLWGNLTNYDPRWVYHGLLIGPPADAVEFLKQLLANKFLSEASLSAMQTCRVLGGKLQNRPWEETGYGLGLMIGKMKRGGRVAGHSGVGPDTVSALYAFSDLPGAPIVAAFSQGSDEGVAEFEAVRVATMEWNECNWPNA